MATRPPNQRAKQSAKSRAQYLQDRDVRRGSSASRGYGSAWRRARLAYLSDHPLCVMCLEAGFVESATVVDHITPHKGDHGLFWCRSNWQGLCKAHHDRDKQMIERLGVTPKTDPSI